jgi:hypothetical protein
MGNILQKRNAGCNNSYIMEMKECITFAAAHRVPRKKRRARGQAKKHIVVTIIAGMPRCVEALLS